MRWGIRKQNASPSARCEEDDGAERGSKGKGKGRGAFSFSPLSWLAKLAAKEKPGAAAKRAPTPKNTAAAAAPAFPSSCPPNPKRTSPSTPMVITPGSSSPPRRSAADAVVPRRRSVGNDNAGDSVAAARRHGLRHHCSVGGDRELPPLGRLTPFSHLAGGSSPGRAAAAAPSDTDAAAAAGARGHRRRRRSRSSRRLSVSGGGKGSSFSGRMPPPRVRVVRSPVAPAELEDLAVVRRTRDPQRAFRESMVEMIASASGGGGVGGPACAVPPRPEELERLLACYLSLNADEHHDCIVKVFRQVWFEYVSLLLPPRPEPEAGGRRRPPTARRC